MKGSYSESEYVHSELSISKRVGFREHENHVIVSTLAVGAD